MSLEKYLKDSSRAMIIGIGGGGDVVGTLPTASMLRLHNIESELGGLPWERSVFDPVPGPRKFEETLNTRKLNDIVWFANEHSTTSTGVEFAEAGVSRILGKETLLININRSIDEIVKGIVDACASLDCDLVIGLDVGGDAVAFGHEKGLTSPLADAIMLAVLYKLRFRIPSIMAIFGFGSDGELTISELENSFRIISKNGGVLGSWGITRDTLNLMKKVIGIVPTEASRMPVEYALGEFETKFIRSGTRKVDLNLCCTSTYYLDPGVVYENVSLPARTVAESENIEDANSALNRIGIKTELDLEIEKLKELED